jgi:hypothetical protein
MAGLDPAIPIGKETAEINRDHRDKPGDDTDRMGSGLGFQADPE